MDIIARIYELELLIAKKSLNLTLIYVVEINLFSCFTCICLNVLTLLFCVVGNSKTINLIAIP